MTISLAAPSGHHNMKFSTHSVSWQMRGLVAGLTLFPWRFRRTHHHVAMASSQSATKLAACTTWSLPASATLCSFADPTKQSWMYLLTGENTKKNSYQHSKAHLSSHRECHNYSWVSTLLSLRSRACVSVGKPGPPRWHPVLHLHTAWDREGQSLLSDHRVNPGQYYQVNNSPTLCKQNTNLPTG